MTDIPGQAIYDYYQKLPYRKLWIHNKYGPKEEMPVRQYFRTADMMPELELIAINNCHGKVLDIGAGAGSHSMMLQEKMFDVTALEISPTAAEVMKLRGVRKIIVTDIFSFNESRFDTLLLLMNGLGLVGTISRLTDFLQHAKNLLNPDGQLLFDSSDVAYLYDGNIPASKTYYGEILYQYEYKKQKSEWFSWLYIDQKKMSDIADEEGWKMTVLYEDEYDQYLARLTVK